MLLQVNRLSAGYGDVKVLWDINLEVREKQIVSLVGANGAGKSTLLKVLSGLLPPDEGQIIFRDKDITGAASKAIVDRGIIHVPEGRRLFPQMTVEENLIMGAFSRRRSGGIQKSFPVFTISFPGSRSARTRVPEACRVASSKCVPSPGDLWATRS
ncbi:ATP-binding cassette domain-containing protein [Desulfosarcina cetonica]|uniref:ATP-binding cassette domain-containing protein n=1 Tax=Desulfosarcina cetonica TaxID=90730 RepID=UPI000AC1E1DC|nr:ATP-binding cassette domain-containing protein [Desulfosarcina cetonica]